MAKLNDRKIRWIVQQKLRGGGSGEIALIQKVSHRRVEQIWQAYQRNGVIPTLKKPGRPKKKPLSREDAELILKVHDEFRVNALTLERVLKHNYGKAIPHNRIHKVLREAGRALPQPSKQKRRKWVRYERKHSMSLWHTDWKQLSDDRWWIAYLDDASRFVVNHGVFDEATTDNSINVLEGAIAKYGCPREILTDRGTQFYASEGERKQKGVSRFESYLAEKGIKHILCRVSHPQTNGKLERFYGVYDQKRHQFKSIEEYVRWHNKVKPHLSLDFENLETPIQAFHRKKPPQQVNTPLEKEVTK